MPDFPGSRALIAQLGLPDDTEPVTVGDYPTGVLTEGTLIVRLNDTETTRLRLRKGGWLAERRLI